MSKKLRVVALLLVLPVLFSMLLTGCGSKSGDTNVALTSESTASGNAAVNDDGQKSQTDTTAAPGERKKIVVIQENDNSYKIEEKDNVLKVLADNGFSTQSADITVIDLKGDEKNSQAALDQIGSIKPDLLIDIGERFSISTIADKLKGTNIPIIVNSSIDSKEYGFIDEDGTPKANVTGIYTMPKDMFSNAYKFLGEVAPIKGKKAVFLTSPGMFNKEQVTEALKPLSIELKEYKDIQYYEDMKDEVLKYNNDDEVGWILIGLFPMTRKDNKPYDATEGIKFYQANLKKPSITFWDVVVQLGCFPCGLGVDLPSIGTQTAEMGVRILKGENIKNIKAKDPKKINIVLNKMKADQLGINFPAKYLGSAKIYTDYEGHVAGQ